MGKILMVNLPFAGHTNPTLPLAKSLVERGHRVTYINAPEWEERIRATGANFEAYHNYPKGLSELKKRKLCFKAAYETVMDIGGAYDVLIYEMFFYLGKIAAERLQIPCVRQFSQCAWNEESVQYASKLWRVSCGILGRRVLSAPTAKKLGLSHIKLVESVIANNVPLNIVYVPSSFQSYRENFDENYIFTCPEIYKNEQATVQMPYEQMKKPIIYISLGSIISSKMLCKKFIKAFSDKGVTVILNVGHGVVIKELGNLPSNIYAYNHVPQLEVLKYTDLFITHGGMNSVNEAMYYGVPMYVSPMANDQFVNADAIERLQIGKRFNMIMYSAERIYLEAMALLQDQHIRNNRVCLQQSIRKEIVQNNIVEEIEAIL